MHSYQDNRNFQFTLQKQTILYKLFYKSITDLLFISLFTIYDTPIWNQNTSSVLFSALDLSQVSNVLNFHLPCYFAISRE